MQIIRLPNVPDQYANVPDQYANVPDQYANVPDQSVRTSWETIYQIKFSDRTTQPLTLTTAATHCDANGLTAVVFLDDEEVGWCDRAGNSGVRIGARCKLFDESN